MVKYTLGCRIEWRPMLASIQPKRIKTTEVDDEGWYLTLDCGFQYNPDFLTGPDDGVLYADLPLRCVLKDKCGDCPIEENDDDTDL
jgi:hypothetical protein